MHPAAERKMLRHVLNRIDNPVHPILSSRWFRPTVWCLFVLLVAAVYALGERVSHWLSAFGFVLLGMGYMHVYFKTAAERGWPVLARYFNREQVEARLVELEP